MAAASTQIVPVGVAGVAGYGGSVIDAIARLDDDGGPMPRVAAVFEAFPDRAGEALDALRRRGVRVHGGYGALLADEGVDAVWLPVPIHLHEPMTVAALAAGKAVMCEKPAAASVAEVDAMIAARDAAGRPVLIGFQEVYDPSTRRLKALLLSGELGAVRRVSVRACWPRGEKYFTRSGWAGRRTVDGRPVHDSPLSNALAHFVNLALFFAGRSLHGPATATAVDARLCRAADIENFDTVTLRGDTDAGPELMAWLTHAATDTAHPVIRIECDAGEVVRGLGEVRVARDGGEAEAWPMKPRDTEPIHRAFARAVAGRDGGGAVLATLELARAHTRLIEDLSRLPIEDAPASAIETVEAPPQGTIRAIRGVAERFEAAQRDGVAPIALW